MGRSWAQAHISTAEIFERTYVKATADLWLFVFNEGE